MEARLSQNKSFLTTVRQSKLTDIEKSKQISSFRESNKITSLALIFSATTSMVGAGILVYPLLYKDNGLVLSQIIVTLIGLISYKTAQLCITHVKDNENDLSQVVFRQLGRKWQIIYCGTGSVYLFLTAAIYYTLILNTLYSQLDFVYNRCTGEYLPSKDLRTFSQFSFSWTNFLILGVFLVIVNLKSLKVIMKLGEYSFIGICVFTLYCLTKSFINIHHLSVMSHDPHFHREPIRLFSDQFAVLAGSCAVAFNVHNMIVPISQQSVNRKNNQRDLKVIYTITFLCYTFLGCLGYMAILNVTPRNGRPNTFMDYVPANEIAGFLVDLFLLFKLCCISPLYVYLGKSQLFDLLYPNKPVPTLAVQLVNFVFLAFVGAIGYFNVTPTSIYAINGSYCGMVLIYAVPIGIHLSCIYRSPCKHGHHQESVKSTVKSKLSEGHPGDEHQDAMLLDGGQNKTNLLPKEQRHHFSFCQALDFSRVGKTGRYALYGFLMVFGIVNSVMVLINLSS